MYLNLFGGSTLLHVLAAHPRVVATLGIAATVTMLVANAGAGDSVAANRYARGLDQTVASHGRVDPALLAEAADATARLEVAPTAATEADVRHALTACGRGCLELTPEIVEHDRSLLRKAVYIAELDRIAARARAARLAATNQ